MVDNISIHMMQHMISGQLNLQQIMQILWLMIVSNCQIFNYRRKYLDTWSIPLCKACPLIAHQWVPNAFRSFQPFRKTLQSILSAQERDKQLNSHVKWRRLTSYCDNYNFSVFLRKYDPRFQYLQQALHPFWYCLCAIVPLHSGFVIEEQRFLPFLGDVSTVPVWIFTPWHFGGLGKILRIVQFKLSLSENDTL